MERALLVVLATAVALAVLLLVVLKVAVRVAKRLGWSAPCPIRLNWLLDNALRRRYALRILDDVGIREGERVLEIGAGPGVFSIDAARRVGPRGTLISVDLQQGMIDRVVARTRKAHARNIEAYVADACDLPLSDVSVDRAFLVTVLSEIPDPDRALGELRRVLKPRGVLSVTEEFPDPDYPFERETLRLVKRAGFCLESRFGGFWKYTLNFRKT